MYIPFVPNDWSSMSAENGIFACCLPWLSASGYQAAMEASGLKQFCNVQVCGCMDSKLFGNSGGMPLSTADVHSWAGDCQGWASLGQDWEAAQMATSLGSAWNW